MVFGKKCSSDEEIAIAIINSLSILWYGGWALALGNKYRLLLQADNSLLTAYLLNSVYCLLAFLIYGIYAIKRLSVASAFCFEMMILISVGIYTALTVGSPLSYIYYISWRIGISSFVFFPVCHMQKWLEISFRDNCLWYAIVQLAWGLCVACFFTIFVGVHSSLIDMERETCNSIILINFFTIAFNCLRIGFSKENFSKTTKIFFGIAGPSIILIFSLFKSFKSSAFFYSLLFSALSILIMSLYHALVNKKQRFQAKKDSDGIYIPNTSKPSDLMQNIEHQNQIIRINQNATVQTPVKPIDEPIKSKPQDLTKFNQSLVEKARILLEEKKYRSAISLLEQSKQLCTEQGWGDKLEFVHAMITRYQDYDNKSPVKDQDIIYYEKDNLGTRVETQEFALGLWMKTDVSVRFR